MTELSSAVLGIAALSVVGRCLLSWFPPGDLGSHRPSEWCATWAASYLLGTIAAAVAVALGSLLGFEFSCGWILAAGASAGIARWLTLPAALVPRHEVAVEAPRAAARLAWVLAALIAILAVWRADISTFTDRWATDAQALLSRGFSAGLDGGSAGPIASPPIDSAAVAFAAFARGAVSALAARAHAFCCMIATLILAERAMGVARRAPTARRFLIVVLAIALSVVVSAEDSDLTLASLFALGLWGLISWTRRADRRAMTLACAAFGAMSLAGASGWLIGPAGLLALVATSARPCRKSALQAAGGGAALLLLWPLAAWRHGVAFIGEEPLAAMASQWSLGGETWLAPWIAPIWIACGAAFGPALGRCLRRESAHTPLEDADRARRDLAALFVLGTALAIAVAGLLALVDAPVMFAAKAWLPGLLITCAPLAAVFAARGLLRGERQP